MPVYCLEDLSKLEAALNYKFNTEGLLLEAITHRSFYHESHEKGGLYNERLEFLGDSILGLVISEFLFLFNGSFFSESEMSRLKSCLVSRTILYKVALEIELGPFIRLGKGEEKASGRTKPSILADCLEAVFGAVFLDGGYGTAKEIILALYNPIIDKVFENGICSDYKTQLQELTQKLYGNLPQYKLVEETGDDHDKMFYYEVYLNDICFGKGKGKKKKSAQMEAARNALSAIEKDTSRCE